MLKNVLFAITTCLFLLGCSDSNKETNTDSGSKKPRGGVTYGGSFRYKTAGSIDALFIPISNNLETVEVASQIYQSLVTTQLDNTELRNCLAKEIKISDDGTTYTVALHNNVFFHDDKCFDGGEGRNLKAADVKYMLEFVCSKHKMNKYSSLLVDVLKGGKSFYDSSTENGPKGQLEGIKVIDDYSLSIELQNATASFLNILTHPSLSVFPYEAIEKYGDEIGLHPVGTGAFVLGSLKDGAVVLKKNTKYWEKDKFGNQLPYMDEIITSISTSKLDEINAFKNEEIEMVSGIPVDQIQNMILELENAKKNVKHKLTAKTSLNVLYYGFSQKSEAFKDKNVRMAFNLVLDREDIVENTLQGEGRAAVNGFVPELEGYPSESIKGYKKDVAKAQELMKSAGFAKGKGFPKVKLVIQNKEGTSDYTLAKAVVNQLNNDLGVSVELVVADRKNLNKNIKNGETIFWRTRWVADYPDAENFLQLFYTGNEASEEAAIENSEFGYYSKEFNTLFEKSRLELDAVKRNKILAKCDQIIIDDAVVMPLLTKDFVTVVNAKARKFKTNEVEKIDFSRIFIKELRR